MKVHLDADFPPPCSLSKQMVGVIPSTTGPTATMMREPPALPRAPPRTYAGAPGSGRAGHQLQEARRLLGLALLAGAATLVFLQRSRGGHYNKHTLKLLW